MGLHWLLQPVLFLYMHSLTLKKIEAEFRQLSMGFSENL